MSRTVREIYDGYRIPPWLQEHQLRVAAVADTVCAHLSQPVDRASVVTACLFHDMGNIIKFDFRNLTDFAETQGGLMYWQEVQRDVVARYGNDEHVATIVIAREVGLPEAVIDIMDRIGLGKITENVTSDAFEPKVAEYGDMRVSPRGIVSVARRQSESKERYRHKMLSAGRDPDAYFSALASGGEELERQLFAHCDIRPEDITDASVAPIIGRLRDTVIP